MEKQEPQFIANLVTNEAPVTIFLTNGVKLIGVLTASNPCGLELTRDGITQLVMTHAIAAIMPQNAGDDRGNKMADMSQNRGY